MTREKSVAQIEREIEAERSALSESLDRLQDQFAPERIVGAVSDHLRRNGGEMARSVGRAAKENPLALALTGVGLAWLIAGPSEKAIYSRRSDNDYSDGHTSRRARIGYDQRYRPTVGGFREDDFDVQEFEARVDAARRQHFGSDAERSETGSVWGRLKSNARSAGETAQATARDAHGRVVSAASSVSDKVGSGASALGSKASSAASSASDTMSSAGSEAERAMSELRSGASRARDGVADARAGLLMRAQEMRRSIAEGTESMTAEARDRVISARLRAYEVQRRIEAEASQKMHAAKRAMDDEPLLAGAIALAAGAAVAALLPRTNVEDEALGYYRDRALDEADRVFREEAAKLKDVAERAIDEGKTVVSEAMTGAKEAVPDGKAAVKKAEDKVSDAVGRVADAAKDEAKRQKLGDGLT